ncbi:unnamed protein product, partial [marine sediment metagenome]
VRGKIISPAITQINLKILKEGSKKLLEVFPEQNKAKEIEQPAEATAPLGGQGGEAPVTETPKEEPKPEEKPAEESKEEVKQEEQPVEEKKKN